MQINLLVLFFVLQNTRHTWSAVLQRTLAVPSTLGPNSGDSFLDGVACHSLQNTTIFALSARPAVSPQNDSVHMDLTQEKLEMQLHGSERGYQARPYSKRSPSKGEDPSKTVPSNLSPTPQPSGSSSATTTVHISSESDFALLLPNRPGGMYSLLTFAPFLRLPMCFSRTYIGR